MVLIPAASVSPGNLLEVHILGLSLLHTYQVRISWSGTQQSVLTTSPGDFDEHSCSCLHFTFVQVFMAN